MSDAVPDAPFPDGATRVRVETPRGSRVKRGLRGGALQVRFLSPVASPFDYGSCPGLRAPDGDEQDAVWLGPPARAGQFVEGFVAARVRFLDRGVRDDKWVVTPDGRISPFELARVRAFFRLYAWIKRAFGRRGGFLGVDVRPPGGIGSRA